MNTLAQVAALIDKGYSVQDALRKVGEVADYFFAVARGHVDGISADHVLSYNDTNVALAETDLWPNAVAATKAWRQSATTLEVVCASANDDAAGSHAQNITIYGLDADLNEISETVSLVGAGTSSPTTQSFFRHNYSSVGDIGTYGNKNDGLITIRGSSGGTVEAYILSGESVTENSHRTIPANKIGFIERVMLNVALGKGNVHFKLWGRLNADAVTAPMSPVFKIHEWPGINGAFQESTRLPYPIPGKTDIWMTITSDTSGAECHVDYDLTLTDS